MSFTTQSRYSGLTSSVDVLLNILEVNIIYLKYCDSDFIIHWYVYLFSNSSTAWFIFVVKIFILIKYTCYCCYLTNYWIEQNFLYVGLMVYIRLEWYLKTFFTDHIILGRASFLKTLLFSVPRRPKMSMMKFWSSSMDIISLTLEK